MDWNKSNTILIIAFIILNIFLLLSTFGDIFNDNFNVNQDEVFVENVKGLLKSKNINVNCEIPENIYVLPVLEAEYDIIEINNDLVQTYLGKTVEAKEDIYDYVNDKKEALQIIDGKKIKFTIREKVSGEITDKELINQEIKAFIEEKGIDDTGFDESYKYFSENGSYIIYTQKHNEFDINNSYMKFLIDQNGIYEFEMQRINTVVEIKDKIRTISAIEALPRLMTYDDIKDKDIIEIKMSYHNEENENWKYVAKTNSDPTWKVIFSDGTQKCLPNFEQN